MIKIIIFDFDGVLVDSETKGSGLTYFSTTEPLTIGAEHHTGAYESFSHGWLHTVNIYDQGTTFTKSIFTLCDYRKNDKCPPWTIQASQMLHDNKKKTIFYDNAIVKVYNVPIFYIPKFSYIKFRI